MGRSERSTAVLGTAAILVVAVGSCIALTRAEVPIAKAATTLTAVTDTAVVSPSGVTTVARDGERVPNGYVVHAGETGSAQLVTRGRVVTLGRGAIVEVVNGAHQQLRTGTAVVDALNGPGVQLDLAGDVLTVPDHSATQATRSVAVMVGSLAGPSSITNSSARRVTIPALYQAVLSGDALPNATTPLRLTDKSVEARAVPALVAADNTLNQLARGIDTSGPSTANVVEAAWSGPIKSLPRSTPLSDQVLPMVIADTTPASAGGNVEDRYNRVLGLRGAGGSWGVVVAIMSGNAGKVGNAFDNFPSTPKTRTASFTVKSLAAPHAPGNTNSNPGHHQQTSPPPTSPPPTKGTHPTPTPSPKESPVAKVVSTVGTVVSKVVGLVPKLISPKPKSSKGLLGGLLGGH